MSNFDHQQPAVAGDQASSVPGERGPAPEPGTYSTTAEDDSRSGEPSRRDRDDADCASRAPTPQDYTSALERIADSLSLLMARLDVDGNRLPPACSAHVTRRAKSTARARPFPTRAGRASERQASRHAPLQAWDADGESPSLQDAWDQKAADDLTELYASGDAGLAFPLSEDRELQARLTQLTSRANSSGGQAPPVAEPEPDRAWLEKRLGEIACKLDQTIAQSPQDGSLASLQQRFEQVEQRLETLLGTVATRADVEGLKILEAHVNELMAQAQEARTGLDRVLVLEDRLGELRTSLSEDRISRLVAAIVPTEQELTRLAETVAEATAQRLTVPGQRKSETPAAASATNPPAEDQFTQLRHLLSEFVDERRLNEQQIVEALDTMQQVMESILDRVDGVEAKQATAEATPAIGASVPRSDVARAEGLADTKRWTDAASEARAAAAAASARAAARSQSFRDLQSALDPPAPDLDDGYKALGIMARRAAGAAAIEPPHDVPHVDVADAVAGSAMRRSAMSFAPSSLLLLASLAAFLTASYWLVTGSRLRPADAVPQSAGIQRSTEPQAAAARTPPSAGVAGEAGQLAQEQQARLHPAEPAGEASADASERAIAEGQGGSAARSATQVMQGIAVENTDITLSPGDLARVRQRQRIATLSSRLGQQAAQTSAFGLAAGSGGLVTGTTGSARADADEASAIPHELPILAIGPHSLRLAAARGDASAQFEVAARFAEGKGVEKDFGQAAVWYRRAATQGLAAAQYRLATLYEQGLGVKGDVAQARLWYQRAAEQGNLKAMHNLAVLSAGRDAAKPDYSAAARWFNEAAEHGLGDSQYNLGVLYESGLGVPKSAAAAYNWFALAAAGGDKEASRRRDLVRAKLDPAALRAADRQIAEWQARPVDQLANDARAAGEAWKSRAAEVSN
jgi:localization factor PodJL